MAAPQFSIVIPTYNYAHFLERSVISAISQRDASFEVLVVDDGSTDNTAQVIEEILQRQPSSFRFIRQENRGPAAARANGASQAQGTWLLFLDADDELLPEALSIFSNEISGSPDARVLLAAHQSISDKGTSLVLPGPLSASRKDNFTRYLEKKIRFSNGASIVHRSALARVNFCEDLRHTEDIPVFAQLLACNDAIAVDQPVLRVHKHSGSRRHNHEAALALGMELVDRIFDNELPDWAQQYRNKYVARRALSLARLANQARRKKTARHFYHIAFRADWRLSLKPRHLRVFLKSLFS